MSYFPTTSPKPTIAIKELLKSCESRIKGKTFPPPAEDQISLSSLLSIAFRRKDFPLDSSAFIYNNLMGLTFRQLDDMSKRIARILDTMFVQIIRNSSPQLPTASEAPTNHHGDSVVAILTDFSHHDERVLVYLLAIMRIEATFVCVQKDQFESVEDWKSFLGKVQPLILITVDKPKLPNTDKGEGDHSFDFDTEDIGKFKKLGKNGKSFSFENLLATRTNHFIDTETGKHKLPLPYFILSSDNLWEDAMQQERNDVEVSTLQFRRPLGQRSTMVFPTASGNGNGVKIKWTRVCNRLVHNRFSWEKAELPVTEDEKFYLTFPLCDPRSLFQIFMSLCAGKPLHFLDPKLFSLSSHPWLTKTESPETEMTGRIGKLVQAIQSEKMSRLCLNAGDLRQILYLPRIKRLVSSLLGVKHWIIYGANNLGLDGALKFFNLFKSNCSLTLIYGTPEVLFSATAVTYSTGKEVTKKSVSGKLSLGTPLYNLVLLIVDDKNWTECGLGQKGEICISTNGMGPENTSFIQSGDLGLVVKLKGPNKSLVVDGKTNNRVKLKGRTIDLVELSDGIEHVYGEIVQKCCVFLAQRSRDSQTIVAAYVPAKLLTDKEKSVFAKQLNGFDRCITAGNCIPMPTIPTLGNGTTDLRTLRKLYEQHLISVEAMEWSLLAEEALGFGSHSKEDLDTVTIVCQAVANNLGCKISQVLNRLRNPFWSVASFILDKEEGPTAETVPGSRAARTIAQIAQKRSITPEEFVSSSSLHELVQKLNSNSGGQKDKENVGNRVKYERLRMDHWNDVIELLRLDFDSKAGCFSAGSLERYWKRVLDDIMKMKLSLVATIGTTVVGCALNCFSFPKSEYIPVGMNKIFGLIQTAVASSMAESLSLDGKIMKPFYIALNIPVIQKELQGLEVVVVRDLVEKSTELGLNFGGFGSCLLCTANPLIQEVSTSLMNFRALLEMPVNRYKTSNYEKPFWDKDDHEKIGVYFKKLRKQ